MWLHIKEYSVVSMARCLDVSRSSYYEYIKRITKPLSEAEEELHAFVYNCWKDFRKVYGLPRILKRARDLHLPYGERKIRRAMKALKIKGKQVKKFKISTTDSNHCERIAPDLVQREFKVTKKNQVWVSDVTFIKSFKGWLYLCVILDLYSRKVVGWSISEKNDSQLILNTLNQAVFNRNPAQGLIFHSDRGSNYCARDVRKILILNRMRRSNSRKGNCWDNAVAESFFSTLKRESEFNIFQNKEDASQHLFDYLEIFYNRQRSHSFLGYVSPEEFELKIA